MIKNTIATIFVTGLLISLMVFPATSAAATYKVTAGDSLYKIGKLFQTSVSSIKEANDLDSNEIETGQKLTVSAATYTIKEGDTLYTIAKKYNITVAALKKANNKKNSKITVGKKLILPGIKPGTASNKENGAIPYTSEELQLLAKLITAEATGQPYNAMVGVGAVVVNRVQSGEWPDSISSVIYQVTGGYYQFSPVKNGYINNQPSETAIKAAKEALSGTDPSGGALFYFDDSSTNQWLWSKPLKAKIDNMVFVE